MTITTRILLVAFILAFASIAGGAESTALSDSDRAYFERVLRRTQTDLSAAADRPGQYVELFKRELIHDPRLFTCRLDAETVADGSLRLTGCVEFDENRTAIEEFLLTVGFKRIDNRVEVLPSPKLGDERFGVICKSHAFSRAEPADDSEVLTDCLLGDVVYLLREETGGYFLCHSREGYLGYVDGRAIRRVDARELSDYEKGPQVRLRENHVAEGGLTLPIGARLKVVRRKEREIIVALPDGRETVVPGDACCVVDDGPNPRIEAVIRAAERLLGTPYVWGGNTTEGVDCSGLVQTAFATEGITLARDSNQQVLAGRLVATRWHREGLRRGDTLYFLGEHGKIRHTALYLGDNRYIEAVRPVVRYSSFDPASPEYSERGDARFCFGKRILD